jgi:hypothetical protein
MTLTEIKRRMLPGVRLLCVNNTYRPELNGTMRTVVQSGPSVWRWRLDGDKQLARSEWGRASDSTIIDNDTFTLPLSRPGHFVTLRFVS